MVASSGLSKRQVQVAIVDLLRIYPWKDGGFQVQVDAYRADLTRIVAKAKASYPNLRLVYVLPFHYAGYTDGRRVTREPFTYQEGFGVRQLIEKQGGRITGSAVGSLRVGGHGQSGLLLRWHPLHDARKKADGLPDVVLLEAGPRRSRVVVERLTVGFSGAF